MMVRNWRVVLAVAVAVAAAGTVVIPDEAEAFNGCTAMGRGIGTFQSPEMWTPKNCGVADMEARYTDYYGRTQRVEIAAKYLPAGALWSFNFAVGSATGMRGAFCTMTTAAPTPCQLSAFYPGNKWVIF